MLSIVLCVVIGILFIYYCRNRYIYYQRENELFNVTEFLKLETIILFSHKELVGHIMKIMKKTNKPLNIQVADNSYLFIPANISKAELFSKIDLAQTLMIRRRYDGKNDEPVKDTVDKNIFDIWLDYGYKQNYRTILRREMATLLENDEISNSTYNEMYRRAFLFERNKYRNKGD